MTKLLCLALTVTLFIGLSAHPDDLNTVLKDIVKRLDEKDARIRYLEDTVAAQEENEARIRQLEKDTKVQKAIAEEQKAIIEELSKTIDQYKHTVESQQERITTLEVTMQRIMIEELQTKEPIDNDIPETSENTTVQTIKGGIVRFNGRLTKRSHLQRRDSENPVAFFASLSNHAEGLGHNQNIAFDNVITNIGDAYNNHAGVFIAPVSGIYVFSTTILSFIGNNNHYAFFKNGNLVTRLVYHGSEVQAYETISNTITLQLATGDDVSVANTDTDRDVYGYHYSTFTGFLLQEIYDGTTVVGK